MILFNNGWRFLKTGLETSLEDALKDQECFMAVDIPHDWLIYQVEDLYEDSCGWYVKNLESSFGAGDGRRIFLRFEGVYMDCAIYLNRILVKEWKYGYSTFDADVTPALKTGNNELLVRVRHQAPNSRWYSGAGIYRNVWLRECGEIFLPFDGTYVVSRPCEDGFLLEADTEVAGKPGDTGSCRYTLWKDGKPVQELGLSNVTAGTGSEGIGPEGSVWGQAKIKAVVPSPQIWDIDSPSCYQLQVELFDGISPEAVDVRRLTIGFRTMKFHPRQGFLLNGRQVKVHGVCEHHDFGCLGAAFSVEAMKRKFRRLREMGVNAIRTSHNMPAPEVMEMADELGFLVVSEAFDMWEKSKTAYDYARFFPDWAAKDVASWVRRDRNHPSLMLWSIGNEIYDTHADERGAVITKWLKEQVEYHDPGLNARVTIGSNYMPWENARKCADLVKIAGYNYAEKYYDRHHQEHPDWIIYGSETASVVQSRGVYHFPLSSSILSDEDEQCSALGNSTTSWGAESVEWCIAMDRDRDYCFGQFLWTGFDYIGEPTPYHTKNSYFGHLDTAGFPKDTYYIFQAEWTDAGTNPMVHVFPYWDFNEGQLVDVRACTNGTAVELFVNGESRGRQEIDHKNGMKLLGEWQVPYCHGNIRAVAYHEDGHIIAEETRYSFGSPAAVTLEADKEVLKADGEDRCFLTVGAVDRNGYPVENAMDYVTVSVEGPGRLLGLDNGDSTDYDQYKSNCRKLFNGKLLAVVGTGPEAGRITVTVTGDGLTSAGVSLTAVACDVRPGISAGENWSGSGRGSLRSGSIPVRKVELRAPEGQSLTAEQSQVMIEARILPEKASDRELLWKVVNKGGIEVPFAKVEAVEAQGSIHFAKVTAWGDGDFWVRCLSKSAADKIKLISHLELHAHGIGRTYLNPYGFIAGGLFTEAIGEITNGNEKGVATSRDGASGVVFADIDFGETGSDEITIPIFALSGDAYPVEIWLGRPGDKDGRHLFTGIYQMPSLWNVYQEVTWRLPYRIRGIAALGFLLHNKVHIKGFCFRKYEKAFERLTAAAYSQIYGDRFTVEAEAVTGIGNNVTLVFDDMDFGTDGAGRLAICGRTALTANTVHILFTPEDGEGVRQIVEFKGGKGEDYREQQFELEGIRGSGKLEFVFLPGSEFDFQSFCFGK